MEASLLSLDFHIHLLRLLLEEPLYGFDFIFVVVVHHFLDVHGIHVEVVQDLPVFILLVRRQQLQRLLDVSDGIIHQNGSLFH